MHILYCSMEYQSQLPHDRGISALNFDLIVANTLPAKFINASLWLKTRILSIFCTFSLPNLMYKLINIVFSQHIYTLSSKPSVDFHDLRTFGRTNYHWNLRIFPANSLLAVKQTPHTFRILDVWPKPLGKITLHLSS